MLGLNKRKAGYQLAKSDGMENMIKVLQEDDCSPDARKTFDDKIKEVCGLSLAEFKDTAYCEMYDIGFVWTYGVYRLEFFADDPYYILYRSRSN